MFNLKSKARRRYAKTVVKEFDRQIRSGEEAQISMTLGAGALTGFLCEQEILKIPETNQPSKALTDVLNEMAYNPSEKRSEEMAQLCIKVSKQFPASVIAPKMPHLLYAAYFKLNADRAASIRNPNLEVIHERAALTNQLIEAITVLVDEFLMKYGSFSAK